MAFTPAVDENRNIRPDIAKLAAPRITAAAAAAPANAPHERHGARLIERQRIMGNANIAAPAYWLSPIPVSLPSQSSASVLCGYLPLFFVVLRIRPRAQCVLQMLYH